MASRRVGQLDFDYSIELLKALPLDARQLVRTKEELLDPGSFTYGYKGMIVACRDEEKLYMLIDKDNPTLEASWKEIGSGGAGGPVDWSDVQNKPTFATVATSGSYNDLSDQPTIPEAYDDTALAARVTAVENGKANSADLAPVATSGSYNDLGDKPTIPEAYDDTEVRGLIAAKANSADLAPVATSGSYNDLGDKPTIPEAYDDTALAARVTTLENAGYLTTETQADWNESDSTSAAYIQNKPTIPAGVIVDDAMSSSSENPVQNKVVLAAIGDAVDVVDTALQGVDARVTTLENAGYLTTETQADWNESDTTSAAYIQNKPTIPEAYDDTALAGRVTAVETALNLTALTDQEIAALVPA